MEKNVIYKELQTAYDFYNTELFGSGLPVCFITLQRSLKYYGYFFPNRFVNIHDKKQYSCEIALNPEYFAIRSIEKTLATLVHEMCHYKCFNDDEDSKSSYHNKYWADSMEKVGLIPTDTGALGGKRVGYKVSHVINNAGLFSTVTKKFLAEGYIISWYDRIIDTQFIDQHLIENNEVKRIISHELEGNNQGLVINPGNMRTANESQYFSYEHKRKSGVKIKYRCQCASVWGKEGLKMTCNTCGKALSECK